MSIRSIVLLLVSILLIMGSSFAQLDWTWFLFDSVSTGIFNMTDPSFMMEYAGQNMTGLDSGGVMASWLEILSLSATKEGADTFLLLENTVPVLGSWDFTGEINSGMISDTIPHLILSEVYYDGTDEWIEITNIGNGNFQGNLTLSGAKSIPVSLMNISILSGESKIFGDTLIQISGNQYIGKTGLALSMTDTTSISIQILISGQIEDTFLVDQYRVNKYNDRKTSFEKMGGIPTRVETGRVVNAQSGYIINPGRYFTLGSGTNVSFPPIQSWTNLQLPIPCDSLDQRNLVKINEIFLWNEKYPPYIELAIHDDIMMDSVSISGNLLATGVSFSLGSWGTTLQKNSFLLISSTGFRQSEGINSVQNRDFSLLSTWNRLVITFGSWQNRRVMDIVYLSWNSLGKSSYFWDTSYQCARILDVLDDFSPGFERKFLKYIPVSTVTKIEYIQAVTGNISEAGSCQVPPPIVLLSWEKLVSTSIQPTIDQYRIDILNIDYDPEGSDTDNEKIILQATHISGDMTPLDLNKTFRLTINGRNKTLSGMLPMNVPTTFTKTFGFPNSTDSWQEVIVSLTYGDQIFDTYTYNPKKLSSQDEQALTTTWYTVSSIIDGDTFRIKYQGKTQSVRLLGIDAPESNKTRYKYLECFGTEAKNYLKTLIDKKKITFQFDPSQDQKDIYDRLLAYVFLEGENINQMMIEEGYAKEYTYKTAYAYQSQFQQAEQSAQNQQLGLWNESTCWVSFSGVQLTGNSETTGTILDLSGLQFTITYVLPNPKWSDIAEELWLFIDNKSLVTGNSLLITGLDLNQGFSLRIGKSKKKIKGTVSMGQENIISWSLGLVNKAACVSLFHDEQELTKFCYETPKEGQKISASDSWLEETPQENLDILNGLQLKKIANQLCIRYKEAPFLCKRIPASKAEVKATQEQKLYKWFASLVKQYIINNRQSLYYDTPLKQYFDLVAQNKKLIAQGISFVDIYGQSVPITDLKQQVEILQGTLPWVVAVFAGEESL